MHCENVDCITTSLQQAHDITSKLLTEPTTIYVDLALWTNLKHANMFIMPTTVHNAFQVFMLPGRNFPNFIAAVSLSSLQLTRHWPKNHEKQRQNQLTCAFFFFSIDLQWFAYCFANQFLSVLFGCIATCYFWLHPEPTAVLIFLHPEQLQVLSVPPLFLLDSGQSCEILAGKFHWNLQTICQSK